MPSLQYFDFIADVWKGLSEQDRLFMGELWKGFEQSVGAIYQKHAEASFNANVDKQFVYSDERWLSHTFDDTNRVTKAATYSSKEDLSLGVNLSIKHKIKFSWDNKPPIEMSIRGFVPTRTRIDEIVSKINIAAGFNFVKAENLGATLKFTSLSKTADSKITFYPTSVPSEDASEIVLSLSLTEPQSFPEKPYIYASNYPRLRSVPVLQNSIRDESVTKTYTEGIDYDIVDGEVHFKEIPEPVLWARRSLFDEEWPWNNFGFLINIYQENSTRYLEIIKGLWFAFWTGPKPSNLRRALYLLFELPTAPYDGYISFVDDSRIEVTSYGGVVTSYNVPSGLKPIVSIQQAVITFDPLVDGIDVFDKVNYPGFLEAEVGRYGIQRFLLDEASRGTNPDTDESKLLKILEEYTFLPQINVDAFVRPDVNLGNVRLFLDAIKPVVKTYLFQVIVGTFREEIEFNEPLYWDLELDVTPNVDSNESTNNFVPLDDVLEEHETTVNPGLCVDSEGVLLQEQLEVDVYMYGDTDPAYTIEFP